MSFSTPHGTSAANKTVLLFSDSTATGGVTSTYTITNLVISNTNPAEGDESTIDVAHLGQTAGEQALTQSRPLVVPAADGGSGRQFTFDYIGQSIILDGTIGTFKLSVNGSSLLGGTTASYYTVQSSTLTLAVNDVIRGQAVISISR